MTVSPPVSPSVVAKILMTQKPKVTAGTLVTACFEPSSANKFPASREIGGNWGLVFDHRAGAYGTAYASGA